MAADPLMATDEHPPAIIAIDGRSGSGKKTLAEQLAARLRTAHTVSLFHLEDIYPGWDGLAAAQAPYLNDVLTPISHGRPARLNPWQWERSRPGPARELAPGEILVTEGVGAACAPARALIDTVVWIEAPASRRKERAIARDGALFAAQWDRWAAQEDDWLESDNVRQSSDIVLRGLTPDDVLQQLLRQFRLRPELDPRRSIRR